MIIKCYAVYDAKISDFHLAIFDIADEGAIRQFSDHVNDGQTRWNKHPEDYSLWSIGSFDTTKGHLEGYVPVNLVNASALVALNKRSDQLELFKSKNGEVEKEPVN